MPWRKSKPLICLLDVRDAALHVFKALAVGFDVRNVLDLALGTRCPDDLLCKSVHRDLVGVAKIEDLTDRSVERHASEHAVDHVGNMAEAARLFARTKNRHGLLAQSLSHKRRNYHAVLTGLPWPHCMEQAYHLDAKFLLAKIRQRQKFSDGLGTGVAAPRVVS